MHVMGWSMKWTVEDNTFKGLFFCATLRRRRRGHNPFVQTGAEKSGTGSKAG